MGYGCYEKMGKLYGNAFFVKIEGKKSSYPVIRD